MNALVSIRDGEARASSQDVASSFEKAHKDVLRAIDKLIEMAPELSRRTFAPRHFTTRGRAYRAFDMDRDGFSLLAMGFTGPQALQWKLKYIDAFNRMEAALRDSLAANDDAELPQSQREGINSKARLVDIMLKMCGAAPAVELWRELGLPMTPKIEALIRTNMPRIERQERGTESDVETGPLWMWTSECDVRPNPAVARPMFDLWIEYTAWCAKRGYMYAEPPVFGKGLRNVFGKEERRGIFNLEVGKTCVGTAPGQD